MNKENINSRWKQFYGSAPNRACAWQPLFYAATRTHCESGNDHAALSRFDPEITTINVFWLWWWWGDVMTVMVSHTQHGTILGGLFLQGSRERDFERYKLYFWSIQVGRDVTERAQRAVEIGSAFADGNAQQELSLLFFEKHTNSQGKKSVFIMEHTCICPPFEV